MVFGVLFCCLFSMSWCDDDARLCLSRFTISDCKKELTDMRNSLLSLDLAETDELSTLQASLKGEIFASSLQVKKLLLRSLHKTDSSPSSSGGRRVKLPKLDVPTFDGNILHWISFWEQFCISDSEKLMYL